MPKDGPVILACNHPMAFTEACLLACFFDRPLHFLVRGDVFKPRWAWFFRWTNQIPVYRFRDGFANMRRNSESFDQAHRALADGQVILIFSEGNTRYQKKLSPLQKGTARLAFGAFASLQVSKTAILPVGVNFADGRRFRSEVMVQVGEPLWLNYYLAAYERAPTDAIQLLTDDLYSALLSQVIHLEDTADEPLFDRLADGLTAQEFASPWPVIDAASQRFEREKALADCLNAATALDKARLQLELDTAERKRAGNFSHDLRLAAGIPAFMIGYITHAVPFHLATSIARAKVRQLEFYTPVRLGLLLLLTMIWYLLLITISCTLWGARTWLVVLMVPLTGTLALIWLDLRHDRRQRLLPTGVLDHMPASR